MASKIEVNGLIEGLNWLNDKKVYRTEDLGAVKVVVLVHYAQHRSWSVFNFKIKCKRPSTHRVERTGMIFYNNFGWVQKYQPWCPKGLRVYYQKDTFYKVRMTTWLPIVRDLLYYILLPPYFESSDTNVIGAQTLVSTSCSRYASRPMWFALQLLPGSLDVS